LEDKAVKYVRQKSEKVEKKIIFPIQQDLQ
jgi:hypothetical protein